MRELFDSQGFSLLITFFAYLAGQAIYKKTKFPLFNPLLIATIVIILIMQLASLDLTIYLSNVSIISFFLAPLVVSLAIPILKKIDLIKKNLVYILVGSIVGSVVSIVSVLWIGPLLGLDMQLVYSIVPKQSTTPIALEVSSLLGGIKAITVVVVLLTAVMGVLLIPSMNKLLKWEDSLLVGMTLGTTSHAMGTAKALETDPVAGAISGIALVFSGIITVLISLFL